MEKEDSSPFFLKWIFVFFIKLLRKALLSLYHSKWLSFLIQWTKFLFHSYSIHQFNARYAKENILTLIQWQPEKEGLDALSKGKLKRLSSFREKAFFGLKNLLLWGCFQSRVERVLLYTFLTSSLEIYNPINKEILNTFLERKLSFLDTLLNKCQRVNGFPFKKEDILEHFSVYKRQSLLQEHIIENVQKAVKLQRRVALLEEIQEGLDKGIHPRLITQGFSGSYWMRNRHKEIVGLFKPFDEEIHALNNPMGPAYQGALGQKMTRGGILVGESCHREVAAYVIDQFFGFGIVPRTFYASFTHPVFFSARENLYARRSPKTKYGSFQEYIEGFTPVYLVPPEAWKEIPLDEFQLLVILDMILGNTDRNGGNFLIGEKKIAAIDHGLTLSSLHEPLTLDYWKDPDFGQAREPLLPSFKELLTHFPFEKIYGLLHKRCFISLPAFERLRERVILFRKGVEAGMTPHQLAGLLSPENLDLLYEFNETLEEKSQKIIENYSPDY